MGIYIHKENAEVKPERPVLEVWGNNQFQIPLEEYIHMAFDVARVCGIRMDMQETEEKYRFDFYLHASVIMGRQINAFTDLIGGSDMVSVSVYEKIPQTVCAAFYRTKEKEKSSSSL